MKPMNRQECLKAVLRGSLIAGIVGLGAVLGSREERFECSGRCGQCAELKDGMCGLGRK